MNYGYTSEKIDKKMEELGIKQIPTAIRGANPSVEIKIKEIEKGKYEVSCPNQKVISQKTKTRYKAEFNENICILCNYSNECKMQKRKNKRVFYFRKEDEIKRKRMENRKELPKNRQNLRANSEATMFEFVGKLKNGKQLRVRTIFKVKVFAFLTGIGINFGRIYRNSKKMQKKDGNITIIFNGYFSKIKKSLKILENYIYMRKLA